MIWRHVVANLLTASIVGLFLFGGFLLIQTERYRGPGPLVQAACVEVPRGARMERMATALESQGVISDNFLFRVAASYADLDSQLKFGNYLVPPEASMSEVLRAITEGGPSTCGTEVVYTVGVTRNGARVRELDTGSGRYVDVVRFDLGDTPPATYADAKAEAGTQFRIVVAEGTTIWNVTQALLQNDLLEGDITEVPEEGAVAPDSYEVTEGADRQVLLNTMVAAQTRLLTDLWGDRTAAGPITSAEDALILASIVEKETALAEERRQVASVFVNRLNRGMRLQTDPTVIYGITRGEGVLGRGLRRSELRAASPFNTYIIEGLPPTPIANPGRASIEAVLDPDETPYIFFVADGTGGHAFSVTLEEHNRNVARWREIEAQRQGN